MSGSWETAYVDIKNYLKVYLPEKVKKKKNYWMWHF